jgi:hypothetical protein
MDGMIGVWIGVEIGGEFQMEIGGCIEIDIC